MANAFVKYAQLGISMGTADLPYPYLKMFGVSGRDHQLLRELLAAHECMLFLQLSGENETLFAVRQIYIEHIRKRCSAERAPKKALRNDISDRVRRFAYENHMDERTVYRRLRRARDIFIILYNK